ncbi:MAG TPA: anthranilate synthase component I [Anaerolineae bacterium]|nr:anthranilate synthase component I [Anaerolineae bacterium]HQH37785.1 anthranilate synthase component I [Anaerolineae bacterium]
MNTLTREQFHTVAQQGVLVPVYRELPADLETPVSVYFKLRGQGASFLLESVERAEQLGRYSFLGFNPRRQIIARGREVTVYNNGHSQTRTLTPGEDPLHIVKAELAPYRPVAPVHEMVKGLPRFFGGAVGYLGYDMVRYFETRPAGHPWADLPDDRNLPDMHLLITDTLVVFDHVQHRLLLFTNVPTPPGSDLDAAYDNALARLDALTAQVQTPLTYVSSVPGAADVPLTSTMTQAQYEAAVRRAKDYIAAGDIFQVVLSQRLRRPTQADPFSIYRALRRINPSPYMFFLELGTLHLIGSSPEVLVRLTDRTAAVRPIAGTRPRGATPAADQALEAELCADPKERAEHVMLVDLGRNDLGRVCDFNTVRVPELLVTESYSHVIHLVSHIEGRLRDGLDAYDLLRATFPAGTLSGAPKIRAMEIIDELEGIKRGPYGGAVGYFGFNGAMDTCITIRTIILKDGVAYLQAGAGIVADSDPTTEYRETLHKAQALSTAIQMAEEGI